MKQEITPEEIGNKDETEWRINNVPKGWEHDGFFVEHPRDYPLAQRSSWGQDSG